jgi:hypothetical protein
MQVDLIHSILVFQEKNIVHITMQVNLIHSKLVFLKKKYLKNKHIKKQSSHESCKSELHCSLFFK